MLPLNLDQNLVLLVYLSQVLCLGLTLTILMSLSPVLFTILAQTKRVSRPITILFQPQRHPGLVRSHFYYYYYYYYYYYNYYYCCCFWCYCYNNYYFSIIVTILVLLLCTTVVIIRIFIIVIKNQI
jgi:hypothetical protein